MPLSASSGPYTAYGPSMPAGARMRPCDAARASSGSKRIFGRCPIARSMGSGVPSPGGRASSTRKGPIAVRRRRTRCAPQPSARPRSATRTRTYVPPEQVIRTSTSRPSNADTSNASTSDPARGGLESVALARRLVELAPADLDGGVRGRRLQRIADQCGACLFDLGSRDVDGSRSHDLAVGVQRVGLLAEAPRRRVRLREVAEVAQEARRSSDAEDQQAGRHRVQRARVADLARSERTAHHVDDVVRGHAGGLVDQHQPLDRLSHRRLRSRGTGSEGTLERLDRGDQSLARGVPRRETMPAATEPRRRGRHVVPAA